MKRSFLIAFSILLLAAHALALTPNATVVFKGIPDLPETAFDCTASHGVKGLPRVKNIIEAGERPDQTSFVPEKEYGFSLFVVKTGHEGFDALEAQCKSRDKFESVFLEFRNAAGDTVFTLTGRECTISALRKIGPNDRMVIRAARVEVDFK